MKPPRRLLVVAVGLLVLSLAALVPLSKAQIVSFPGGALSLGKAALSFPLRLVSSALSISTERDSSGGEQEASGPGDRRLSGSETDADGIREGDLLEREVYWADRVGYPTGRFDPAWVREAIAQDATIERAVPGGTPARLRYGADSPLALDTTGFTALGPSPERMTGCSGCFDYTSTQGRVNSIAIDPLTTVNGSITAYIATVGGGVWKTTNCCSGSTTWTPLTDGPLISTTSVDTVTLDPSDHNTIYAGTGDLNFGSFSMGSQGILKSTDGGANWTVLGANVFGSALPEPAGQFPQYQAVGKVRVDPNNGNKVVAGTKTGLYVSYDGGNNWTGPCLTNSFSSMRQDITGLELTNMGGGVTRILAAVGVRGFATTVQYNLDQNGANGLYAGTMPSVGCPVDFTSIASNANGFVFGTAVTGSPYATGALMNAGTGTAYVSTTSGNQLGRMDIAVAPSNPNVIYAQVQSIAANNNSGCGNTAGCQLGVWSSTDGGATWSFMAGSQGGALRNCVGTNTSGNPGDYPQNWYDQGIAVDPNNPDRVFIDTYDTWFATRTGTSFFNQTCGYNGGSAANHVVHVDHHALAFVPGSSDILLEGSDGGIFSTTNASTASSSVRATWVNMDTGLNTIEFYNGDIGANFATDPAPQANGGAQDNGPSSVTFSGSPSGPVQWQMGLGGDGFSGQINSTGTGLSQAQGTITVTGAANVNDQFQIGSQVFTFVTTRSATGQVTISTSTTTEANNIVAAINADISGTATGARTGSSVVVTATAPGAGGNSIVFSNITPVANFSMNGSGFLGGTTSGGSAGTTQAVFWQGNNSGGLSRCVNNCTVGGATWSSKMGGWGGDTQSFILPINLFHGGIPGGDDNGGSHLLAATTRVWETVIGNNNGTLGNVFWYVTNNPTTQNLTKQTLGNRSFINQVKYSPKYQSVAIVGTNDGNVQIGFNLGTGAAGQGNWVNVTDGNAVLPNRPILGIALDPSASAANLPVGYAAVGGFDQNTPTTPGHLFQVTCTATCGSFIWADKTGNLPNIPADSVIVNPNFPQQVFVGTDIGLYFTDDITAASPVWGRFNNGLPNVMIWDMAVDRGSTSLSLWTRGHGAFAWPLPSGAISTPTPTPTATNTPTPTPTNTPTNTPTDTPTPTNTPTSTPTPRLITSLSPAKVWVGLTNSDAVGIRFDLQAIAYLNNNPIGTATANSVSGGSSGFNNAVLTSMAFNSFTPQVISTGDTFAIQVFARNACLNSGKNSGSARLWYNGQPIDTGSTRDAGSRFDATVLGTNSNYYLRTGNALSTTAGSSKASVDVNAGAKCGPFVSFGTWSTTLP